MGTNPKQPGRRATGRYQATEIAALIESVRRFDEAGFHSTLSAVEERLGDEATFTEILIPLLREVGAIWERRELTEAHEHFVSQLVRRRLTRETPDFGVGTGPVAVLACPPQEEHDLALLCFAVLIARRGWRVRYLGARTPTEALARACDVIGADLVVVAGSNDAVMAEAADALREIAQSWPVALAGAGSGDELAARVGARLLPLDIVDAVGEITDGMKPRTAAAR